MTQTYKSSERRPRTCAHTGLDPVRIGPYAVRASGTMYQPFFDWFHQPNDVVFVPLVERKRDVPVSLYGEHEVVPLPLVDFGGVPADWRELLEERIVPRLAAGNDLLAFCAGSHGRTGTFLASLIALLETPEKTPDPIAAVRMRHCNRAVETLAQAEGIFALRGQPVPQKYLATMW